MSEPAFSIRALGHGEVKACERILRGLPEWFGIEQSLLQYVRDVAAMDTVVADASGEIVGFATVKRPNPTSAELQVIAVRRDHQGRGIGLALVETVERALRGEGFEFLQVKTLGPSRPNREYERTRSFYRRAGFRPLEENRLWGDANPCLIMIKSLRAVAPPIVEKVRGEYSITTDRARMDIDAIHAYLTMSYWAEGIPRDVVAKSIEGALCFGVFHGRSQVGFARMVTDHATFAYLADVYILEPHRGRGLSKWLMETIFEYPSLRGLRRFSLVTRDAHGLYRKYGFTELAAPERHMEMLRRDVYRKE